MQLMEFQYYFGDFRQLLPVVKNCTQGQIVKASIKRSFLWPSIKVRYIFINKQFEDSILT